MKTEKQQGHMTDMTRGDSLKVIIRFALPLVAAAVLQQLFSLTDAMVRHIQWGQGAGCAGSLFMARVVSGQRTD